jgi:hypothetical protein
MIAADNARTIRAVGQSVVFGDKTFEVVKEIVYLESLVTPNNGDSKEESKEENPGYKQMPLRTAHTN